MDLFFLYDTLKYVKHPNITILTLLSYNYNTTISTKYQYIYIEPELYRISYEVQDVNHILLRITYVVCAWHNRDWWMLIEYYINGHRK